MPYMKNGEWYWGNLHSKHANELQHKVWGIWMKEGGKGKFEDFWLKGKITEDIKEQKYEN